MSAQEDDDVADVMADLTLDPVGNNLLDLSDDLLERIAALMLGDSGDLRCSTIDELCTHLKRINKGSALSNACASAHFWRSAYRLLLNLPVDDALDPRRRSPAFYALPPHRRFNHAMYFEVKDQEKSLTNTANFGDGPVVMNKWEFAFRKECNRVLTSDTLRDAVTWCKERGTWRHPRYGSVRAWRVGHVTNFSNAFQNLNVSNINLEFWDTSSARHMTAMFQTATQTESAGVVQPSHAAQGLEQWDVSGVLETDFMFANTACFTGMNNFNQDLSRWDVSSVTNTNHMFCGCAEFDADLSRWNTARVRDMSGMFHNCKRFRANLSRWNVEQVTRFENMFHGCVAFGADLSHWKLTKYLTTWLFDGVWFGILRGISRGRETVVQQVLNTKRVRERWSHETGLMDLNYVQQYLPLSLHERKHHVALHTLPPLPPLPPL